MSSAVSAGSFSDRYVARMGDHNGDGMTDLFVTANKTKVVFLHGNIATPIVVGEFENGESADLTAGEFILEQQQDGTFHQVDNITPEEKEDYRLWPESDTNLSLDDFNFDGALDLVVELATDVIDIFSTDINELIIYASPVTGATPLKLLPVDEDLQNLADLYYRTLSRPETTFMENATITCNGGAIVSATDTVSAALLQDLGFDLFDLFFGFQVSVVVDCEFQTTNNFDPYVELVNGLADVTDGELMIEDDNGIKDCGTTCYDNVVANNATAHPLSVILPRVTGVISEAALARMGLILASAVASGELDFSDAVTVSQILIPVILTSNSTPWLTPSDNGMVQVPNAPTLVLAEMSGGDDPDTFGFPPPGFNPDDPEGNGEKSPKAGEGGSAKTLRKNLERHGYEVPEGWVPHHIVPIKGRTQQSVLSRQIISRNGVRIDHAANGVPLPHGSTSAKLSATRTVTHHSATYTNAYEIMVFNRLNQAELQAGSNIIARRAAVRAELAAIRSDLLSNTFF